MNFDIMNIGFWDDFHLLYKVNKGIYFAVLNMHDLKVVTVSHLCLALVFLSNLKQNLSMSDWNRPVTQCLWTFVLFPQFPICYFSYWIILHLPLNPAAINSNHTFDNVLSGAQALIALITCCRVIALTQTNSIYGPICCCLLSPACIAPSRLCRLSALFDSTHGGQNFRGHHASDLALNEIDVCWTEGSGWGWHTSSMPRLFLPSYSYFILLFQQHSTVSGLLFWFWRWQIRWDRLWYD